MSRSYKEKGAIMRTRGFLYELSRVIAFVLFLVLTVLPIAPVYASDDTEVESTSSTDISTHDTVPDTESDEVQLEEENEPQNDEAQVTQDVEIPEEDEPVQEEEITPEVLVENASSTEEDQLHDDEVLGVSSTTEPVAYDPVVMDGVDDTMPTSTPDVIIDEDVIAATTTPEELEPQVPEEDLIADEEIPVEVATTTITETVPENIAVSAVFSEDNEFMFSKNECVSVGDGSFYCSSGTSSPTVYGADRVFSAVDRDGDREIYVEREGELIQISANLLDDDAPYFDENSNTIVWHRLIDDRYQIISYDVETEEETQLTNERHNNMEPARYDEVTVWQSWVGNDWEIMLEENGALSMITDNTISDISPRVNGNYIIWQAFENNAWRVKVYDRITKEVSIIEDADGASVDNPRFVLVYDTKHENGDVETKGYDLESGEVVPLNSKANPIPQEIPDPEQTGEERALVQPLVQPKTKIATSTDDGEPDPDTTGTGTTTDEDETDIVIPPFSDTGSSSDSIIQSDEDTAGATSSIPDVTIPSFDELLEEEVAHINDLIITPFVEPIAPTGDSQEVVASST